MFLKKKKSTPVQGSRLIAKLFFVGGEPYILPEQEYLFPTATAITQSQKAKGNMTQR